MKLLKFLSPSNIKSRIAGGFRASDEAAEDAKLGADDRAVAINPMYIDPAVGAYQQMQPRTGAALTGQQNFFGSGADLSQILSGSWGNFRYSSVGIQPSGTSLDYARLRMEYLADFQGTALGMPMEPAVRIDPIFTELAVGMYSLAVDYSGAHNCSLGDDPLVDRLPLRLAEELFKLSQLLKGSCPFSPEGKELIKTILDIANTGSYQYSTDCNSQKGPPHGANGCKESRSET